VKIADLHEQMAQKEIEYKKAIIATTMSYGSYGPAYASQLLEQGRTIIRLTEENEKLTAANAVANEQMEAFKNKVQADAELRISELAKKLELMTNERAETVQQNIRDTLKLKETQSALVDVSRYNKEMLEKLKGFYTSLGMEQQLKSLSDQQKVSAALFETLLLPASLPIGLTRVNSASPTVSDGSPLPPIKDEDTDLAYGLFD
jgi:hypothetical protein